MRKQRRQSGLHKFIGFTLMLLMTLNLTVPVFAKVIITEAGSSFFDVPFTQSSGYVGVMVIPVEFEDEWLPEDATDHLKEVFRGSGVNGNPSVLDYYQTASYGDMFMDVVVQRTVTLPGNRDDYADPEWLIDSCMEVIAEREVPVDSFDENGDEYLDALYIIFAGDGEDRDSFWWPHTETFYSEEMWEYGAYVGGCSFLSYDMLMSEDTSSAMSAIHETGHLLGLTDYYQSFGVSGTKADTMMDLSKGDLDCFSKMMLGWSVPQTVTGTGTYYLTSETISGDSLIISVPGWDGNYLSEYFMVEYVTPTENQSTLDIPQEGAIRIWHVNAGTSAFTNDVTPDMFKAGNAQSETPLLRMADPSIQWLLKGESLDPEKLTYYDGTFLGAEIKMIECDGEEATVMVSYGADPKADIPEEEDLPELPKDDIEMESIDLTEEKVPDDLSDLPKEVFEKADREKIFSFRAGEPMEDMQAKGRVSVRELNVPVGIAIAAAFFLCFLLIRGAKKDQKAGKKARYIRHHHR